jgi:hypothetical protein
MRPRFWLSLGRAVLLAPGTVGMSGCNPPPRELVESAVAPTSPSASPSAPSPASSGSTCARDADCRTFSSYCAEAPCACRTLLATAPDPKCFGTAKVSCFVDPCMKKAASCQAGSCVLTAK